ACLGEIKQSRNRFLGDRELAPNDTRGGQPEHHLEMLRWISKTLAQFSGASERDDRIVRCRPLGRDEAGSQGKLKIELTPILFLAVGQISQRLDASLRMRDRL